MPVRARADPDTMTATSPRTGFRPRVHRLLSRLAAVLVVGAVLSGAGLPGGAQPASAAEGDDAPPAAVVTLGLSIGTASRIEPAGPMVGTVTVRNDTENTLSAGTVTVEVDPTPLRDGAALDAWFDDGAVAGTFRAVSTEPSPEVAAGDSAAVSTVADAEELGGLAPGVYPVRARLTGATTDDADGTSWTVTTTSVVVVSPASAQTVGVLVPITATPEGGALLTADELADLTAPDGMLTGQLDAVTDTSAILAVDPAIPAAIRVLGSSAPAGAVAWLQRLQGLPNDTFALQLADADPATQSHAGQETLLTAPDLTTLLDAADFPTPAPEPTPTGTSTPAPQLPDNTALTTLLGAQTGILWPRGDVTAADLSAFDGYLGMPATTILPSSSLSGTTAARAEVDGHGILVTDAAASARLSAAAQLTDPAAIDRDIAAAAGHLYFTSRESATALVGLSRSETRSPVALRSLLSAFGTPGVGLAGLRAAPAASAGLKTTAGAVRPAALKTMLADERRLQDFSSILDDPDQLLAPERIRLMRTIAVGLSDDAFTTAVRERAEHVRTLLGSVTIQRPKPVQLIAASAPLPVWVRNDLPWPVQLSLHSEPSDPRLDIQSITRVEAAGAGSTRVDVPISARVASGEVQVEFRLTSPTGVQVGTTETAEVTLRADWETIGLSILGGVIALLLVFGLIRTVRRKRRDGADAGRTDAGRTDAGLAGRADAGLASTEEQE
ncbi:DUF6049 family protein [Microbacterium sp. ARD32]|uniref:DUF6049 family protein n=1 Tax=Microbacterium sp. ARD32 TaxID=2962577 RepID=UPI0028813724|nr:DUF6049 family protein [Microbacterium sp. ARD32]MDT0157834.1 DUF6049 family protein [Microbacterium sp. ARD32]